MLEWIIIIVILFYLSIFFTYLFILEWIIMLGFFMQFLLSAYVFKCYVAVKGKKKEGNVYGELSLMN